LAVTEDADQQRANEVKTSRRTADAERRKRKTVDSLYRFEARFTRVGSDRDGAGGLRLDAHFEGASRRWARPV
jgi:hypothetical protein